MTHHEQADGLAEDQKKLVTLAITPIPLEENRIRETLRRARYEFRGVRTRRRLAMVLGPVVMLALLAAGFWHWSGWNSEQELAFGGAIEVTEKPGEYAFETLRAASGKIWKDTKSVLIALIQQGAITAEMRDALLAAIDRPQPTIETYPGGFEELRHRVSTGQALAPEERTRLTQALCAGISAIRRLGAQGPRHADYARILCQRLRTQVTGEAAASPGSNEEKARD